MPSSRRIVCRASRISPWRAASRIFACASRRVIELVRTTGAEMPRPSRPYLWDGRRLIVCGRRDLHFCQILGTLLRCLTFCRKSAGVNESELRSILARSGTIDANRESQ
jgi:hypothetical protein